MLKDLMDFWDLLDFWEKLRETGFLCFRIDFFGGGDFWLVLLFSIIIELTFVKVCLLVADDELLKLFEAFETFEALLDNLAESPKNESLSLFLIDITSSEFSFSSLNSFKAFKISFLLIPLLVAIESLFLMASNCSEVIGNFSDCSKTEVVVLIDWMLQDLDSVRSVHGPVVWWVASKFSKLSRFSKFSSSSSSEPSRLVFLLEEYKNIWV